MYNTQNKQRGISLIEVLISAAMLLVFLGAITTVYTTFIQASGTGIEDIKSYYLVEEGIEAVKTLRNNSWTSHIAQLSTTTTYYLLWDGSSWHSTTVEQSLDGFYRTFTVRDAFRDNNNDLVESGIYDSNTRKLEVSVSWLEENATSTRSIETYITNIFDN